MNKNDFGQYLHEQIERAISYDAKFSRENFEICFLVSKSAYGLLREHSYGYLTITEDPFECASYLFGHRVAFVNGDYIPRYDDEIELIQPVIVCKKCGVFPLEAEVGDYIYFNSRLIQVKDVGYISGSRSFGIEDICVGISDDCPSREIDRYHTYRGVLREIEERNQIRDAWVDKADPSAINEYLSSLPIT